MANEVRRTVPWTVMVYMTSDTDLELFADQDLAEMQKVGSVPGKLHVVVQLARKGFPVPARFYIKKNKRERECNWMSGPKNAGDPRVLGRFLKWTRETYPARNYMLVLWGHAFGVGFGRVGGNALTISELSKEIGVFGRLTPNGKLDILGCDACSMSKAEATYQFRDSVGFLVASQTAIPYAGWPYEEILSRIAGNPGISARQLSRVIVEKFIESYTPPRVALTAVDVDRSRIFSEAVGALSTSLVRAIRHGSQRIRIRRAFKRTASGSERALIDLEDFCRRLIRGSVNDTVTSAARATVRALREAVIKHDTSDRHARRPRDMSALHGVGIYAPPATDRANWELLRISPKVYGALDLMGETAWDGLVSRLSPHLARVTGSKAGN